jgi:hypothetical protein
MRSHALTLMMLILSGTLCVSSPVGGEERAVQWKTYKDTSQMDDSIIVSLELTSSDTFNTRYEYGLHGRMSIWCRENRTGVGFNLSDEFLADIDVYGEVQYRVDKRKARSRRFFESTDNMWLLLEGGAAISFIRELIGGGNLFVRVIPFNDSPKELNFRILGINEVIKPVAETCHWSATARKDAKPTQPQGGEGQPSSVGDQLARNELSELIRRKVEGCWNVPAGARESENLLIEIRVTLNRDGSVYRADIVDNGRMSDSFYREAAESARRAVQICSPFSELPADRYDVWHTSTLRFNPKEMLGT